MLLLPPPPKPPNKASKPPLFVLEPPVGRIGCSGAASNKEDVPDAAPLFMDMPANNEADDDAEAAGAELPPKTLLLLAPGPPKTLMLAEAPPKTLPLDGLGPPNALPVLVVADGPPKTLPVVLLPPNTLPAVLLPPNTLPVLAAAGLLKTLPPLDVGPAEVAAAAAGALLAVEARVSNGLLGEATVAALAGGDHSDPLPLSIFVPDNIWFRTHKVYIGEMTNQ